MRLGSKYPKSCFYLCGIVILGLAPQCQGVNFLLLLVILYAAFNLYNLFNFCDIYVLMYLLYLQSHLQAMSQSV